MDPNTLKAIQGAAGGAADPVYVDDVFSVTLHTGTSATHQIVNGIDLAGEGGMTWFKQRTPYSDAHYVYDSHRDFENPIRPNEDSGHLSRTGEQSITSYNSNGFTMSSDPPSDINASYGSDPSGQYVCWTFRKQKKFFDIVTWTGNGSGDRTLSHNLGSVPGCVIVKRTDGTMNWGVYHRETGTAMADGGELDTTFKFGESGNINPIKSTPTSTQIEIRGGTNEYNTNTQTYVAYLFGHNEAAFGENGNEVIIKCGKYTGNGSTTDGTTIELGFEPQWVLHKGSSDTSSWLIWDTMRGFNAQGDFVVELRANENATETERSSGALAETFPTGFKAVGNGGDSNYLNDDYIYIAIARSHKPPEAATDLFGIEKLSGSQSSPAFRTGVLTDMGWARRINDGDYYGDGVGVWSRATGNKFMGTAAYDGEGNDSFDIDNMTGFYSSALSGDIGYSFKRAKGFFDVVTYDGTGGERSQTHNLGVVPELIIVKCRSHSTNSNWMVYNATIGNAKYLKLNDTGAATAGSYWASTTPTTTGFTISADDLVNGSSRTYVAYLFATLEGISKVGTYSGTAYGGSDVDVNCGFSGGARFVLIKRTDDGSGGGVGSWYMWDTVRGIVSGNDPYNTLNGTDADQTTDDYIDPLTGGFRINASAAPAAINALNSTFIYLAIA